MDSITAINNALDNNASYYLVEMFLDKAKPGQDFATGQTILVPYYGVKSSNPTVQLGGLNLLDTAKVFIPGAPKGTGSPSPGWWPKNADGSQITPAQASKLPASIFRVVEAVSPTVHRIVKELPILLTHKGVEIHRTWAEAQDSIEGAVL